MGKSTISHILDPLRLDLLHLKSLVMNSNAYFTVSWFRYVQFSVHCTLQPSAVALVSPADCEGSGLGFGTSGSGGMGGAGGGDVAGIPGERTCFFRIAFANFASNSRAYMNKSKS